MRFYAMGLITFIIAMNIPQVKTLLEERVKIYAPQVRQVAELSYNEISSALLPFVGKVIGKPKLLVDGKVTTVDTSDDMNLNHGQSLTIEQIDAILSEAKSPAIGTGQYWIQHGLKYKIDAAYMLGIFYYESTFATNTGWAGWKPDGTHTYNIGNMICAGYALCEDGFRDYSNDANPWSSAIEDNTHLLAIYRDNNGINTFGKAIAKWAPTEDGNCVSCYVDGAERMIRSWRNTNKVIVNEGGTVLQTTQENGVKVPFGDAQAVSAPILETTDNAFGINVRGALDARNGALRNITIKDGEQWSFNETIGNPDALNLAVIVHLGDGWCDLACRYVQVFKGLGIPITHGTDMSANGAVFLQHGGISLNQCSFDESPYIWSSGYKGFENSMQDLVLNNGTGKTIRITVVDNEDGTATIAGRLE